MGINLARWNKFALRLIAQMYLRVYSRRANVYCSLTRISTHIVLLYC